MASPMIHQLGIPFFDKQAQSIQQLTEDLKSTRFQLEEANMKFTSKSPNPSKVDLEQALCRLAQKLEPHRWSLQRPKQYLMRLNLFDRSMEQETRYLGEKFNLMNETCYQMIQLSEALKNATSEYLANMDETKKTQPAQHSRDQSSGVILNFATESNHTKELDKRIEAIRDWEVNENKVRFLLKEAQKMQLYARQLFRTLVDLCAIHLFRTIG